MNKKRITITIVAAVSLLAFGCAQAKPEKSEAIERAVSDEPTLTSTAAPAPPKPIEEKENEVEAADASEAPTEQPKPVFEPVLEGNNGITIERLITATAIENREPIASSSVFRNHDEMIYAFLDVRNDAESEKTLMVHFIGPDGRVSGGIELHIPASVPRWRTWAYTKHARKPGLWRVEIRSVDGSLLGALPFEVESDR